MATVERSTESPVAAVAEGRQVESEVKLSKVDVSNANVDSTKTTPSSLSTPTSSTSNEVLPEEHPSSSALDESTSTAGASGSTSSNGMGESGYHTAAVEEVEVVDRRRYVNSFIKAAQSFLLETAVARAAQDANLPPYIKTISDRSKAVVVPVFQRIGPIVEGVVDRLEDGVDEARTVSLECYRKSHRLWDQGTEAVEGLVDSIRHTPIQAPNVVDVTKALEAAVMSRVEKTRDTIRHTAVKTLSKSKLWVDTVLPPSEDERQVVENLQADGRVTRAEEYFPVVLVVRGGLRVRQQIAIKMSAARNHYANLVHVVTESGPKHLRSLYISKRDQVFVLLSNTVDRSTSFVKETRLLMAQVPEKVLVLYRAMLDSAATRWSAILTSAAPMVEGFRVHIVEMWTSIVEAPAVRRYVDMMREMYPDMKRRTLALRDDVVQWVSNQAEVQKVLTAILQTEAARWMAQQWKAECTHEEQRSASTKE